MERRNFLRAMLGVAAATALPSEVWPFRKIFLPAQPSVRLAEYKDYSLWTIGPDGKPVCVKSGSFNVTKIEKIMNLADEAPLIWTANEEQLTAWRRKFKQYGLD
jgi:hypothetical protein